jgi:hypothetical protein
MMSASVQCAAPQDAEVPTARLSQPQVAAVFKRHVPGVQNFLFRQQPGQYSLNFLQVAYKDGFRAFKSTPLHKHFLGLFRLIVHYGHEDKDGASGYLVEVAEAFMDCQAVQARAVERVGLRIRGVSQDFRGLVVSLADEYKSWAVRMLAAEHLQQRVVQDDETPTHYENRLIADLGSKLGLNPADIRRARHDEHARSRFKAVNGRKAEAAMARCREHFDAEAMVKAFVAEANSFSSESPAESLPMLFLQWASENLVEKHIVFDGETCSTVDIDSTFAISVLEVLFLGATAAPAGECFRNVELRDLFKARQSHASALLLESKHQANFDEQPQRSMVELTSEFLSDWATYFRNALAAVAVLGFSHVIIERGRTALLASSVTDGECSNTV